jgi:tripartite-type tricarboxylate transporter receptor subunit TctC
MNGARTTRRHRHALGWGLVVTTLAAVIGHAGHGQAQSWPTRAVTIVDPIGAGAVPDTLARIMVPRLSELLGQPVIVENASGAGGMIGVNRVAKAAPDGYQIVIGTAGTHAYNQTLFKNPLYDAAADFAPISLFTEQPLALVTRRDLPVNNLQEFIAYAKAHQAQMQYGSLAGTGSANHIICALFNASIGVVVSHVPYRPPSALAYQDLITGRIDYVCPLASGDAKGRIESGQVRGMAIFSKHRSRILPDLATADEQGLTDFEGKTWNAFFAPKRTPAAIVARLHDAIVGAMDTPGVRARLEDYGAEVVAPERRSPEHLQRFVEAEIKRWADPIKEAGAAGQ